MSKPQRCKRRTVSEGGGRLFRMARRAGGLAAAAAGGLALSGCEKEVLAPAAPPAVEIAEAALTDVPMSAEIIGQLDSPQNVEIRARVEAFVKDVFFEEGKPVQEGQRLFALDKEPFEQRLAAAMGLLAEATAAVNKYEKDVARLKPLAEAQAIPLQDLDNAEAAVAVGAANVQSAEARVASAKLDLTYCDVDAPISGLIGAKQVSIGELVGKGEPTLLATISVLDPIWFYCNISEVSFLKAENEARRSGRNLESLPITLILADGSVHPAQGKFVFIDRAVDAKTGTLRLRAEFDNPEGILRPGMFARIKVDLGVRSGSIVVPERAVTELQGRSFLWVVGADNTATQRGVTVGEMQGEAMTGRRVILEGLQAGERYVVEGVHKVREGMQVRVQTAEEAARAKAGAAPEGSGHSEG